MFRKGMLILGCTVALLSTTFSSETQASYTKRDGRWEASFQVANSLSTEVDGQNGSSLELDSDLGWGFTLGYNLNPHILLNFDFTSLTPDYKATLIEDDGDEYEINHKMNVFQSQFNVVYNFMTEQFTPFVQAGLGWSFVDSNVADGPPTDICWWDPWWGYICERYQNTYSDSRLAYNVAAGFRYELDNSMFFRASYQQSWVDLSNSDDLNFGTVRLEIGSMF